MPAEVGVELVDAVALECAIEACENSGPLLQACANGHWLHFHCFVRIAETSNEARCPLCRSSMYLEHIRALAPRLGGGQQRHASSGDFTRSIQFLAEP